ncbi:polysaccharide pyruvyl transferase CsaB [Lentibacillus sediminis]|uniref:polysaccharide pyruvyl transferase CsaB n=1 Tax=Lentibacillus sediminis TaxID=1940529 RepID=UPI000C1B7E6C|nr:polysaccharide pyruvyl transferase CsaB [Lentibacillus sediminis]
MHVVLSGYYGYDNVGDEAILLSIIGSLRQVNPEIEITVLSSNPASTARSYMVNAVNSRNVLEISQAIRNADGLISGGGSLLQDKTGIRTIPYYTGIIKIADWYNKPVFIYAQGVGPIKSSLCKWIVKNTLNKVKKITVRDQQSKKLLNTIGVKRDISVVPDPVLGLDTSSFINKWKSVSPPYITVSVRNWPSDIAYMKKMAGCLDQLKQEGYSIVFVPMHGVRDEKASRETAAYMAKESFISPADASVEEKIALIGDSCLLIGMRLHALIFSAIKYSPFVALSYDPKIDAFASIFEQSVAGHVNMDDWDRHSLFEKAKQILEDHALHQSLLKGKVQQHKNQAWKTSQLALDSFSSE